MIDGSCAILVFSKAPVPGQVKTRLLPALGEADVVTLYIELVERTLREVSGFSENVQLYCTPDTRHPFFQACRDRYGIRLYTQTGADLGERMANAIAGTLGEYASVIIIGCDCPELDRTDLSTACGQLRDGTDIVLGPCEDGGYYLVGMSRPIPGLFTGIHWGTANVLKQTRHRVNELNLRLFELPVRWDLDDVQDLGRLRAMQPGFTLPA